LVFQKCLLNRYKQLKEGLEKILLSNFNALLFRKGEEFAYAVKGGKVKASIVEVTDSGTIVLQDKSGKVFECGNKELEYKFD
ncbi:MAG: hypothetical protein HKO56_02870, partial [Bacteroidia bacterium]|nr:hypothetical protein [Bacteroidia bacterium]